MIHHRFSQTVLVFTTALLLASTTSAEWQSSANRESTLTIQSKALGEERTVVLRLPARFDANKAYPVVYVLDAEWNFEYIAAYLDNMVLNGNYPPMVVTGIVNVNRNRDYVPRSDPHFMHTGEADSFLAFAENEWMPAIESRFSGAEARVLVGHSFGGVFALHTLFTQPELFDAYLAMGSSAWIGGGVLLEEARALFASDATPDAFVWMAVGEGDGGPTVPSSRDLAAVFELEAPPSLEWTFSVTPRTDHFTNFITGTHEAFMALFPAWGFKEELAQSARALGAKGVEDWFAGKQAALDWRFQPNWFDLGVTALGLARDPVTADAALAVTAALRNFYPDNAFIALYSATVYESAQQFELALSETERALALAQAQNLDPNELQLEMLTTKRDRIMEQLGDGVGPEQ